MDEKEVMKNKSNAYFDYKIKLLKKCSWGQCTLFLYQEEG